MRVSVSVIMFAFFALNMLVASAQVAGGGAQKDSVRTREMERINWMAL